MEKLVTAILSLFEQKSIPATIRYLLLFGAIAALFSLAGFPVVDYVESLNRRMIDEVPRLHGALVWGFFGVTISQIIGPGLKTFSENVALSMVKGSRNENGKAVLPEGKKAEFIFISFFVFMAILLGASSLSLLVLGRLLAPASN